jgi:glycosyltransferase involved in cell wall biosynthesis
MRVLVLHSRYLSADSGENRVVEDEVRLLEDAGADVRSWTPTVREGVLRTAVDAVWSHSAASHVRELARSFAPDVIHVHSLYPRLSPAVLRASDDLPVVATLHNFRLHCLPATHLRDGVVCEACVGRNPWRGVAYACYRDSRKASAALASSLALHRGVGTFTKVAKFLAVSNFVRDKHIEAGLEPERILVKDNFASAGARREGPGRSFVTLGRLSREKGLSELLDVWPDAHLRIVGDGPDRASLTSKASDYVNLVGSVSGAAVPRLLASARALLQPSRCYEAQPRAILEAFAAGVPVIASRIGGLPELVKHGVNGLLVDLDDRRGWQEAVERLMDDSESERLGEGAYRTWQERFTPEIALRNLENAYAEAIAAHG